MHKCLCLAVIVAAAGTATLYACASPPPPPADCADQEGSAITGGTLDSLHPEVAIIDILANGQLTGKGCSGAVIAPQVVLTSGTCLDGNTAWRVTTPNAQHQVSNVITGETLDWANETSTALNPEHHDFGLLYLQTAIHLDRYPLVAPSKVNDGAQVVAYGRNDGNLPQGMAFASQPFAVRSATEIGYPLDFLTDNSVIGFLDQGGPLEIVGSSPGTIIGVASGGGSSGDVFARVDFPELAAWITVKVQMHGGPTFPDAGTFFDAGTPFFDGGAITFPILDAGPVVTPTAPVTTFDAGTPTDPNGQIPPRPRSDAGAFVQDDPCVRAPN